MDIIACNKDGIQRTQFIILLVDLHPGLPMQDHDPVFVWVLVVEGVISDRNVKIADDEIWRAVIRADQNVFQDLPDFFGVDFKRFNPLPGVVLRGGVA